MVLACVFLLAGCVSAPHRASIDHAEGLQIVDAYTLSGEKDFLRDYKPTDSSGNITVVVALMMQSKTMGASFQPRSETQGSLMKHCRIVVL